MIKVRNIRARSWRDASNKYKYRARENEPVFMFAND